MTTHIKYIKRLYLVLISCTSIFALSAQRVYTLDECIQEAVSNNARIKNANNNLSIARHTNKEAFTNYFPSLSASGTGYLADKGLIDLQLIPGKTLSLIKNGVLGSVTASVPIFTGGSIINANKLSKVNVEASRLQRDQSENEVKLTTEQYYWQIVMLKEKLKTITIIEEQLKNLHKEVDAAVSAGITNRNDLLQVQLQNNETRSTRIQIENALVVSRNLLAQYIGHPEDSIDVSLTLQDTLPEHPDGLYTHPETALPLTNEYNLLKQNVKAAELEHKISIGKNLPTIAIGGGYMYDNLMDEDHSVWMGFATVSVPISGWWGGSHNIKKHKLQVINAENQLSDQSQLLVIHMKNTWNSLTEAYKQVEIAIESIGQATENLRLQTEFYQAGTCTMSDLLKAQTLFQQSRDNYVESYAQYEIKKREYLQATGR